MGTAPSGCEISFYKVCKPYIKASETETFSPSVVQMSQRKEVAIECDRQSVTGWRDSHFRDSAGTRAR